MKYRIGLKNNKAILILCVIMAHGTCANKRNQKLRRTTTDGPNAGKSRSPDDPELLSNVSFTDVEEDRDSTYRTWTLEEFPNPQKQPKRCGRHGQKSYLCDPDNLMTAAEAHNVDRVLNVTCSETRCECTACSSPWYQQQTPGCEGYKIAVGIVNKLAPPSGNTDVEAMQIEGDKWAKHLRQFVWKYGICGDDVVIIVITSIKQAFSAVGPKAAEIINVNCVTKAHNLAKTDMQQEKFAEGITKMISLYKDVLVKHDVGQCAVELDNALHPAAIAVITLFSGFTIVIIVSAICCVWGTCRQEINKSNARKRNTNDIDFDMGSKTDPNCHDQSGSRGRHKEYSDRSERPLNRDYRGSESEEDHGDPYGEYYSMSNMGQSSAPNGAHAATHAHIHEQHARDKRTSVSARANNYADVEHDGSPWERQINYNVNR